MTPEEFRSARNALGLSQNQLAHLLGCDERTIRKWESEEGRKDARAPNPIAVRVMGWFASGFRPPEWPAGSSNDGSH
jgi:DNA-binding transcriptional regulator YiaG